jgi:hypothetical protein
MSAAEEKDTTTEETKTEEVTEPEESTATFQPVVSRMTRGGGHGIATPLY